MKPIASLSPTLLARKGAAKPAMRPQFQPLNQYPGPESFAPASHPHDDLGWNDMGHPHADEPESTTVVPFGPAEPPAASEPPEVVRRQDALAERFAPDEPHAEPTPLIPLAAHRWRQEAPEPRRSALADGRRAAFTLRVDGDRHLKLRLACTVQGRSAQQLVTEALDSLLAQLPELDDLARRVKRR